MHPHGKENNMEINKNANTALRQALEGRREGSLSSNFTFRMMEQVRIEAQRQHKRKVVLGSISLITASLLLIALAVYALVFRLNINWGDFMPQVRFSESSSMIGFYGYIAVLVLALLGLDHLLRATKRKKGF
ncbi:MAG: hypothetical protein H6Q13_2779 [Bacteroidetes bacterium]|nr:hypothetical protein [Bacteroidota bacterium]